MKRILFFCGIIALIFIVSGCLTVEKKTYTFKIEKTGVVTLTIDYYNIVSQDDDGQDVSFKDFGELVTDYMQGEKLLETYPEATIKDKKLFEKNGVLCGQAVVEFPSLEAANLKQYKGKGPIMHYLGSFSETFDNSNGDYWGANFPVIAWEEGTKDMVLSTIVTTDLSTSRPLLSHYKIWKETNN